MNILMCNKFYFPRGGTERYLFSICKGLENLGHRILTFSMRNKNNLDSEFSGYFIEEIDLSKKLQVRDIFEFRKILNFIYSFPAKSKIEQLIKKYSPDVAHLHNIYHHISSSIIHPLKKNNIATVMTLHDYNLICPNYSLFSGLKLCERCKKTNFYEAVINKCVKNSRLASLLACFEMYFCRISRIYENQIDMFIAPSRFLQNKYIEFGIDRKKIVFLPHAIDLKHFSPHFEPGQYILYFGDIQYRKGVHLLLTIAKHFKHVPLKIIGSGLQEKFMREVVSKDNLTNVEFLGYKSEENLAESIANALFVIVPSLWHEVAGLAIYEAFASGKCVVAAHRGGIPEIVRNDINGILFDPEDEQGLLAKIRELMDNQGRIEELGRNGFESIKSINDPTKHHQMLESIYADAIKKHKKGS